MRHSAKVSNCVAINKFLSDCTLVDGAAASSLAAAPYALNGLTLSLCVGALRRRGWFSLTFSHNLL